MPADEDKLFTAAEFLELHGHESGYELIRGRIVPFDDNGLRHGEVCGNATFLLHDFVKPRDLGRMTCNDTYIHTTWNPDSIRDSDVAFISYSRLPKEQRTPEGPFVIPPELVIEVRSPEHEMREILNKSEELLVAGVAVVVLVDPDTESVTVFRTKSELQLGSGDELALPDILTGFSVPVMKFFE